MCRHIDDVEHERMDGAASDTTATDEGSSVVLMLGNRERQILAALLVQNAFHGEPLQSGIHT